MSRLDVVARTSRLRIGRLSSRTGALYGLAFALAAAVIIAGFWPSFYSNPAQNTPIRTVHGLLASSWLVILVAQPWLIAFGQPALHRAVGRFSVVCVSLLVISMAASLHEMMSESLAIGDPLPARVIIGFVNLTGIPLVLGLYAWGVYCGIGRDIAAHMRLMACTVVSCVPPGLVRLLAHVMHGFGPLPLLGSFGLVLLVLVAMMVRDGLVEKRVYGGVAVTFGVLAGTVVCVPFVANFPPYLAMIRAMGYPG